MRSKWTRRIIPVVVILFSLFPCFVTAGESENASALENRKLQIFASITKGASAIKTISSDFIQERRTSMLKEPLIATGKFFFEKPERLRWEFLKPSQSGFAINGERTRRWRDNPEQSEPFEIGKEPAVKTTAEQVFAWARGDFIWIEERYQIVIESEEPLTIMLIPRSPEEGKYIRSIAISFSSDLTYVNSVEIREKQGDSTRIRFVNSVLNTALPEGLF